MTERVDVRLFFSSAAETAALGVAAASSTDRSEANARGRPPAPGGRMAARLCRAAAFWGCALAAAGCAVADGTVSGGTALLNGSASASGGSGGGSTTTNDPCAADGGASNWATLYRCDFGPNSAASCGAPNCHGSATDLGTAGSGFLCGATADSCWHGLATGLGGFTPIVPSGGATDATSTSLWQALRKPGAQAVLNNMPLSPASYVFTQSDLGRIQAWIQNGAPNN